MRHLRVLLLSFLVLGQLCSIKPARAFIKVDSSKDLENLFYYGTDPEKKGDKMDLFDLLTQDIVPTCVHQEPNNRNGTASQFKKYALLNTSNDDASFLTSHRLNSGSRFKYEIYDAIAKDGYVTQVTRLINPLVDESKLREPPILIEHGGSIEPTAYILASNIQHLPEKWPRIEEERCTRSWNRSLAFYLANMGFKVFLADTRGSNERNKHKVESKLLKSMLEGTADSRNLTASEKFKALLQQVDFWAFSQEDIVQWEYRSHIDTVRRATGSDKIHMVTSFLSTPTSLAFLGQQPDYADKIQGYVSMAPIVSSQGVSPCVKLIVEFLCPFLPDELGTLVVMDTFLAQPVRDLLGVMAMHNYTRYSILRALSTLFMGAGATKWRTLLEINLIGHLFRKLSFRELKQMCQQMRSNKLQKYDYGPFKNALIYGSLEPPAYDISHLNLSDWLVVSGETDPLSSPEGVRHLSEIVNPKPIHMVIKGFNHLDLFAGWENDIYVNAPIAQYLERMSDQGQKRYTGSRSLDIVSMFSHVMKPIQNVPGIAMEQTAGPNSQLSTVYINMISKGVGQFFETVTENFSKMFMKKLAEKTVDTVEAAEEASERPRNTKPESAGSSSSVGQNDPYGASKANPLSQLKGVPVLGNLLGGVVSGQSEAKSPTETTKVFGGFGEVIEQLSDMVQDIVPKSGNKVGSTSKQYLNSLS